MKFTHSVKSNRYFQIMSKTEKRVLFWQQWYALYYALYCTFMVIVLQQLNYILIHRIQLPPTCRVAINVNGAHHNSRRCFNNEPIKHQYSAGHEPTVILIGGVWGWAGGTLLPLLAKSLNNFTVLKWQRLKRIKYEMIKMQKCRLLQYRIYCTR